MLLVALYGWRYQIFHLGVSHVCLWVLLPSIFSWPPQSSLNPIGHILLWISSLVFPPGWKHHHPQSGEYVFQYPSAVVTGSPLVSHVFCLHCCPQDIASDRGHISSLENLLQHTWCLGESLPWLPPTVQRPSGKDKPDLGECPPMHGCSTSGILEFFPALSGVLPHLISLTLHGDVSIGYHGLHWITVPLFEF